jgi:hypothetical protein
MALGFQGFEDANASNAFRTPRNNLTFNLMVDGST